MSKIKRPFKLERFRSLTRDEYFLPATKLTTEAFSLPLLVAFFAVARAMRPLKRTLSQRVAVLIVPAGQMDIFVRAARSFFSYDSKARYGFCVLEKAENTQNALAHLGDFPTRDFLFIHSYEMLASFPEVHAIGDFIQAISVPTERHYRNAIKALYGAEPGEYELGLVTQTPWDLLDRVFRPGRSYSLAIDKLRRFASEAASAAAPSAAAKDHKSGVAKLADLQGYGAAKTWGLELARDLKDFGAGRVGWSDIESGATISGLPGTGKTTFVRALALEAEVHLVETSAAQWQSMGYLNDLLKAMRDAFAEAAEKAPSILFIDEIDSFGSRSKRQSDNARYMRIAINGLLECLDPRRREGVVVIGATNEWDALDPAIVRSGRLGRRLEIPLPSAEDRIAILIQIADTVPTIDEEEVFSDLTDGMTGADIEEVVRKARRKARISNTSFTVKTVLSCFPPIVVLSEAYRRSVAVHEAGHALVATVLGYAKVKSVSVRKFMPAGGSGSLGVTSYAFPVLERRTRDFHLCNIATLLGGIAAERVAYGDHADGSGGAPTSDLAEATDIATSLVASHGMGSSLIVDPVTAFGDLSNLRNHKLYLLKEIDDILTEQLKRAEEIVSENRAKLDAIVEALLENGQLSGGDVASIIGRSPPPHP
ncbi:MULTISPECIES: AAA family ATPase [Rhizobium]|uniref:AAA family ATPase n=1 Tax=Rhizobium TaxID=379 RepID=UPI00235E6AF5|nr:MULTISPECIES: AAA family ATPase [unclassified Rhizobium]MDC9812588.1 AAA family ATPase [Rhizobium sp. MC62]WEA27279.1 AAA family ATPase [Rhizobium sp. MJ22]WEA61753.1 AAA family ATPase [Rhizobium sp. BJ04]